MQPRWRACCNRILRDTVYGVVFEILGPEAIQQQLIDGAAGVPDLVEARFEGNLPGTGAVSASFNGEQNTHGTVSETVQLPSQDGTSNLGSVTVKLSRAKLNAAQTGLRQVSVLVTLVAAFVVSLIGRRRVNPLESAVHMLQRMGAGDLTGRLSTSTEDEVGRMGSALNRALGRVSGTISTIWDTADNLSSASDRLASVSQQMKSNADANSQQTTEVSTAVTHVTQNVQNVAIMADEMAASIQEISRNAADAARVASGAVESASTTNEVIARLAKSSSDIDSVLQVISTIAQQTNLLALNATIEAARAGEAGKGFAVVAKEVKELAEETSRATEEINQKVDAIQSDTRTAMEALGGIGTVISQIHETQTAIAGAVEEADRHHLRDGAQPCGSRAAHQRDQRHRERGRLGCPEYLHRRQLRGRCCSRALHHGPGIEEPAGTVPLLTGAITAAPLRRRFYGRGTHRALSPAITTPGPSLVWAGTALCVSSMAPSSWAVQPRASRVSHCTERVPTATTPSPTGWRERTV